MATRTGPAEVGMSFKLMVKMIGETVKAWSHDNAARLAAALAYYTILSLAPLLVLAVSVAGLVFGEDAARGLIADDLSSFVGPQAGAAIQTLLKQAHAPEEGVVSSIIGVVVLLFGASGVFGELQAALNTIWEVEPKPGRGFWGVVRDRFFSFTMVMGVAFLLLVSLMLSTLLSAVGRYFSAELPGGESLWQVANFVGSSAVITGLFALIFKVIPDVKVAWRDVWLGALFTALMFTIGKFGLGVYLGTASVASPFGAAGSLIVLVIWIYYAAQILFFGAEFTQVYARRRGKGIVPSENAVAIPSTPEPTTEPQKGSAPILRSE